MLHFLHFLHLNDPTPTPPLEKTPPLTLPCMGGSNYGVVAFRVGAEPPLVGIEAI